MNNLSELEEPRRYLIAIGSPRCDKMKEFRQLPEVEGDLQKVTRLFEQQGYTRVLYEEIDPADTSQRIKDAVSGWFCSNERRTSDIVVVYYAGHGYYYADNEDSYVRFDSHYLFTYDSVKKRLANTAIETRDFVKSFFAGNKERSPQNILLILDTCYAHTGARQMLRVLSDLKGIAPLGSGFWILSSADALTEAGDGAFVKALETVMQEDNTQFQNQGEFLGIDFLVSEINQHLKTIEPTQKVIMDSTGVQEQAAFIRNPQFSNHNLPPLSSICQDPVIQVLQFTTPKLHLEGNRIKTTEVNCQVNFFTEDLGADIRLEMIGVSGGTFQMGASEADGIRHANPIHQVTVEPFFLSKYLITQEQWERVANSFPQVNSFLDLRPSEFRGIDNLPVEGVSWFDAFEFCARLTQQTGRNYRLPSEAEWEYACRSGTTTPFYLGETITTDFANYDGNINYVSNMFDCKKTTPVTTFRPNAFGLYDMHGNLWEWCEDIWHETYKGAPSDGTAWLDNANNSWRLLRGGSWGVSAEQCRSAHRHYHYPDSKDNEYGFRVVCNHAKMLRRSV
jgi:formylglycine-generating enzyme required for sulfatase activity